LKKIIVLLVIVIAIFVGAPYITGKIAETETLKLVDNVNKNAEQSGNIDVLTYERSMRSTKARYQYTPPPHLAVFTQEYGDIILNCDSSHGITGIDYSCLFEGESTYSKFVAEELNGKDPISIYGSVSAFGGLSQTVEVTEVKDFEIDGGTLTIPNANITIGSDTSGSEISVNGKSDAFNMQGNGLSMAIGKMNMSGDLQKIAAGLFVGDFLMKLDSITSSGPLGETKFNDLSVLSEAGDHGENISSKATFTVGEVSSALMPFESVKDVSFGLDIQGLDKNAMVEYQKMAQSLQAQGDADISKLMPVFEKMLKKDLNVNSQIKAKLNGKPNNIDLNVKLLEGLSFAQLPEFMTAPDQALKKVDAKLAASLSKEVVDSQPLASAFIANSPLVAANSDDYAVNLELGEKIELNGKALSFVELQTLIFTSLPF